jgi:hypothetical protein
MTLRPKMATTPEATLATRRMAQEVMVAVTAWTSVDRTPRQDRTPPVLGTKLEEFTYVKPSGQPMEPAKLAAGYSI